MASIFGISSIASFAGDESGAGIALAGISAAFVASAVRGNNVANDCRGAFREYDASVQSDRRQQFAEAQRPRPVLPVAKQPRPRPLVPDPQPIPSQIEPTPEDGEQPVVETPPEYTTPRPPPVKPPVKQPEKPVKIPPPNTAPKPPPKPDPGDEDWSNFWKELP